MVVAQNVERFYGFWRTARLDRLVLQIRLAVAVAAVGQAWEIILKLLIK